MAVITRCLWNPQADRMADEANDGCQNPADLLVQTKRGSLAYKAIGMRSMYLCLECAELAFFAGCNITPMLKPGLRATNDPRWPVIATLKAMRDKCAERLTRGLALLADEWPTLSPAKRIAARRAFREVEDQLFVIADWLERVPNSTIVICRKCKRVNLPITGSTFKCCGAFWTYHRTNPCHPLPADFWATHDIGSTYKGKLPEPEDVSFIREDDLSFA
jgi:hypothetical protein